MMGENIQPRACVTIKPRNIHLPGHTLQEGARKTNTQTNKQTNKQTHKHTNTQTSCRLVYFFKGGPGLPQTVPTRSHLTPNADTRWGQVWGLQEQVCSCMNNQQTTFPLKDSH